MRVAATLVLTLVPSLLVPSASLAQWADEDESTCVTCHEYEIDEALAVPVPEWRESVHAEHWVSCDACHGGDPRIEDADESMSEEAGFLDNPSWTEMADYCGVCHERIAESYHIGRFGQAVRAGTFVPTCATCHMQDGHRTLAAVPADIRTAETCPDCPGVGDPERAVAILDEVREAKSALLSSIDAVEAKGIELSDFRRGVAQVHEGFERAVHQFDAESLDAARALAVTQYQGLGEQVAVFDREAARRMRLGLGLLTALALTFAALWMMGRAPRA